MTEVGAEMTEVGAEMTERGFGMVERRRNNGERSSAGDRGAARLVRWLAAFHPPPNLPPERGEG